ncbi:unnamed protein product [Heterosigma akashiwo]
MLKKAIHGRQANKCLVCKTDTTLRCQRCKKAAFCSRGCLKAGWRSHKKTCCGTSQK